jgi:hypothetical protein
MVDGNATLFLHDTGIFVNCTGDSALFFNGTANISMDANAQVVGNQSGCTNDMSFPISPGTIQCGVPQQTYDQSYFDQYARTLPTPTCSYPGTHIGSTWTPGYFPSTVTATNGDTFGAGTYCFLAGFNPGANPSVNISGTGDVKWVLSQKADLPATANFESLEIYNGAFTLKSSATLNANRFRFFGNGNTNFTVQGGTFTSGNAYIYSQLGEIDINAQANVVLQAPPPGDTFAGVLMYMPWENPNDFILNGGTGDIWTGLVLMPQAHVTYNGQGDFELHGQVIAYEFKINGGSSGHIYFESTGAPTAAEMPAIELTK